MKKTILSALFLSIALLGSSAVMAHEKHRHDRHGDKGHIEVVHDDRDSHRNDKRHSTRRLHKKHHLHHHHHFHPRPYRHRVISHRPHYRDWHNAGITIRLVKHFD